MDPPAKAPKRPMAFVRRVSLFQREIRENISPTALNVLLRTAGKISEGQTTTDGRYYGSTMLTIDLGQVQACVSDVCDVSTAVRLAQHLSRQGMVHQEVKQIAEKEARRIACRNLELQEAEVRVRTEGQRIYVDVDVEGVVAPATAKNGTSP